MPYAAGLCPNCGRYLMVIPEDMGEAWTWNCFHCHTLFATEKEYYAPRKDSDTDRGRDEPEG